MSVTVTITREVNACQECPLYEQSREHGATISYCVQLLRTDGLQASHINNREIILPNCPFRVITFGGNNGW